MKNIHLTTIEVADRLQVKPATLRAWRMYGRGPAHIKVGRLVRYPLSLLLEWEDGHTRSADTRQQHPWRNYPEGENKP